MSYKIYCYAFIVYFCYHLATTRLHIDDAVTVIAGQLIIDVRSPLEYAHAHIPEAINIPIFDNAQRAEIGTTYKQVSREKAVDIGLAYFAKRQFEIIEAVKQAIALKQHSKIIIYCARGGMRSGAVAWLMSLYAYDIIVLEGGYKAYRNWALQQFEQSYDLKVVGGYTGSRKTQLLPSLISSSTRLIDLENIACHKGSAFGAIGMPVQPSQEMFENILAIQLYTHKDYTIWLEDESQRIGNVRLPNTFWQTMRNSPLYFVEVDFETRLNNIVQEYGDLPLEKLIDAVERITKKLGGQHAKLCIEFLQNHDIKNAFAILLQYYDKKYTQAMEKRENLHTVLQRINKTDLIAAHTNEP